MEKIRLQDDFYTSINKEWLENTKIPDGYSSWGTFSILAKTAQDNVEKIILELVEKDNLYNDQSDEKKIINLYNNFLNFEQRNKQNLDPIKHILLMIENFNDLSELTNLLVRLYDGFEDGLFNIGVEQDFVESHKNVLYISSMGLGMGTREYYEKDDENTLKIQKAYKIYLTKLFKILNKDNIEKKVDNLYNFEKKAALSMFTQIEKRDPYLQYNVMNIEDIQKLTPSINWKKYFIDTKTDCAYKFVVEEPKFFIELEKLINEIDIETIKDYLQINVLDSHTNSLTEHLYNVAFEYSKVFSGTKKPKPLNERVVKKIESYLGEIVGKKYVEKHFPENSKKQVIEIINKITKTLKERINNLNWMSSNTKAKALQKLETFKLKIGYPDKWDNFSDVEILTFSQGGNLVANSKSISEHYRKIKLKELETTKVDPNKWYMYPQVVNAYYNPSENVIVFPAAILQAPFFDPNASLAQNLGGIGAVIGHEIIHGFDDEGSKFDKDGNLNDWWTKDDRDAFNKLTKKLEIQYNNYESEGLKLNGKLTLGENIADLGGALIACEICKNEAPNDLKQFFQSFANVEKTLVNKEYAKYLVTIDPHSPAKFRVNGVLVNIDEFYNTYNIQKGDGMWIEPNNRVRIW